MNKFNFVLFDQRRGLDELSNSTCLKLTKMIPRNDGTEFYGQNIDPFSSKYSQKQSVLQEMDFGSKI